MNLPNALTVFRLGVALLIGLPFLMLAREAASLVAFVFFVLASITDWLDGHFARKWNQISAFGRMLDPIADKIIVLMTLALMLGLVGLTWVIVIPVSVIFFREVLVSGMREFLGDRARELQVTNLAKWKTAVQMVAIGAVLLGVGASNGLITHLGLLLLWIAAVLTTFTGADYARKAISIVGMK